MRKILGGMLCLALAALPVAAAEKDDAKVADRAEQFRTLKADYAKAEAEFIKAYRAAKTEDERKEAFGKRPNPEATGTKVLKLIEADPKDDLALEMLSFT